MLQYLFIIALCAVTTTLTFAETQYRTEKVCEIVTTKQGSTEKCRRVYVPDEKSEPPKKTDKK